MSIVMTKTLKQVLNEIADRGIKGIAEHYPQDGLKCNGGIAGFNACREVESLEELKELLESSRIAQKDARDKSFADYWWYRYYSLQVEWVCNCISVLLYEQGLPTIVPPTVRAASFVATIVGVKGSELQ